MFKLAKEVQNKIKMAFEETLLHFGTHDYIIFFCRYAF